MSFISKLMANLRKPANALRDETLYEIFLRNSRRDVMKWHHYFDIYEKFMAPFRGTDVRLLEIGVLRGGSLRMWREYLGSRARIAAVDIEPGAEKYSLEGYDIYIGDQADPAFLATVRDDLKEVDIVIDDGGHTMRQQVNSFEALYPITKKIYLVEDTHSSYSPEFHDRPQGTFMEFAKAKVDVLHEGYASPDAQELYRIPPPERTGAIPVSDFCATTRGVHFYDSIVVFEKGSTVPRWRELR